MTSYLLAGGGTAGHVNPLLAVADRLREREPESEITVLGTAEGLEARLVPERGYALETIPRVPFPRRPNRQALRFPADFRRAVTRTRDLMQERGVRVVIGFGGYAATPAYVAARGAGVPVVVHEANARPGLANVWGARHAAGVGTVFPGTRLRGAETVGMPLRREIAELDRAGRRAEAAEHFGLDAEAPVLLVFGGSAGARRINGVFAELWPEILARGWQLLHVTGDRKLGEVATSGAHSRVVVPYIDRMDLAYALADLAVCRSGSATVSELSALGIPAVYVPYAVGNGEQARNARGVVAAGGALLIPDASFTPAVAAERLLPLLADAERRERMRREAAAFGTLDGADRLLALVDRARAGNAPGGRRR
ncbi:UDP-N-acetylglucosamine--N-acetylmuramyl-(pentapeptide) pyrophosphoryl-undecaprenol N-acetylglucosamine transferase [Leucobacter sp. M11]|uniref:UDP-N-acetylglucosamine--N-acetylmuramyl- (pentapeptide) pyrophosphoryl-undecaprenol N-acetylglucosamine transferase n=1 Tax=Leucobacter sp. M11 TaxID=2993565 RepID=UPI002D803CF5|nr:UDP-N-acetylglucosamine--N-acetylmuramyl-(pentapeptide) pyrophosphoryl-undecaprenol N-acetylglucosamine transferase [Leucobacter sp. M11]MEB4614938.1 UDP-N-acetylglucosamine--N-acetylmuramyl-(pentapeptide) pyrophosphoryl-undecaprenol N-acetylglucosamine transferase [Leucobacter sp. M11]